MLVRIWMLVERWIVFATYLRLLASSINGISYFSHRHAPGHHDRRDAEEAFEPVVEEARRRVYRTTIPDGAAHSVR